MTETAGTLIVPIAFAIAVAAVLLLVRHVARRYAAAPARIPWRIGWDGRASKRSGPKAMLWIAPGLLAAIVAALGVFWLKAPPPEESRAVAALVFVLVAEAAWFNGWLIDREIELARKMTFRIAPARLLRVAFPLLATIAIAIVVAARS